MGYAGPCSKYTIQNTTHTDLTPIALGPRTMDSRLSGASLTEVTGVQWPSGEEGGDLTMTREEIILEKLRSLPPERLDEVLDFVEFLERRAKDQRWIANDAWAMNMAKERGFSHLTEEDVAQIVKAHRRQERL
ncbi:TPA: hypothetical protein DCY67_05840 [Candidatus Acetothermia bacterium]|nr:hypothetical protein [Candidatus Acetothermia bacterium]